MRLASLFVVAALVLSPANVILPSFSLTIGINRRITVSALSGSQTSSDKDNTGLIVPIYFNPYNGSQAALSELKNLMNTASKYPHAPIVAIVNPDNGQDPKESWVVKTCLNLSGVGITVLGYVYTENGQRSLSEVEGDIANYSNWYKSDGLSGIFFDQMNNAAGGESYYQSATSYAHSVKLNATLGNPGTDTISGYIGTVNTMNTYEGTLWSLNSSLVGSYGGTGWHLQYYKGNFSAISYNQSLLPSQSFVQKSSVYLSYMYVTNGIYYLHQSSNPYSSIPPYISTLASYLNASSVSLKINSELTNGTALPKINDTTIYSGANIAEDEAMNVTNPENSMPYNFNATSGWKYLVSAKSQGEYVFDYWNIGGTNDTTNPITVTPTQATTLTAYYSISSQVSLTIKSAMMNGTQYSGMYTVIEDSNHNTLKTGFTPLTYTATTGTQYYVQVDNYGIYTFNHWSTGSTSDPLSVTPTQSTTLIAYFSTTMGVDSVANSGYCYSGSCGSSVSVTLSTHQIDELIMVYTSTKPGNVAGVSDTQGLLWSPRYQNGEGPYEWYAFSPGKLSSDKITVSFTQSATNYQVVAFSVYGGIIQSFDPNSAVPALASGTSTSPSVTFSTSNGNDLVVAYLRNVQAGDTVSYPTGYTQITTATTGGWEYLAYKVFSSAQSGTSITWSQTYDGWVASADALSGAGYLGVDSVANSGYCYSGSCASSVSLTLSTTQSNEIVMVYAIVKSATLTSVSDTDSLSWHQRYTTSSTYEWYALAPSALSSDAIKVTFSTTPASEQVVAFSLYGVDSSSFDPGSGVPASSTGSSSSPSVTFSTSNGDDLVIGYMSNNHAATVVTYPSGYIPITTATSNGWEYLAYYDFSSAQSGTAITWSQNPSDGYLAMADALST